MVVQADPGSEDILTSALRGWGYQPVVVRSVREAATALINNPFLFTILDVNLGGADGTELLRRLALDGGDPGPLILLSEGQDVQRTAQATALGADDWIQKPIDLEDLDNAIKEVLSRPRRVWGRVPDDDPAARLRQEMALWQSPQMRDVWETLRQAARVDVSVLIGGETGTGKDLVARAIHYLSARQARPFVKVNCGAVPREFLESELFGHERGAFTEAHQLKIGKFESAARGTIFLDEIGDLHPALQAKLLHVLQDGAFSRLGGKSTIRADVRILAATNRDLERAVVAGQFREDLHYRLNVIQIVVPPLRVRPEEIPLLAEHFVQRYSRLFHREGFTVPPAVMERLVRYRFPGNVRELENMIKRMIILGDPLLVRASLPASWTDDSGHGSSETAPTGAVSLKEIARTAAREAEREAISKGLEQTGWNRVRTAKLLKISYRALLYKIKEVGLDRERPFVRSTV